MNKFLIKLTIAIAITLVYIDKLISILLTIGNTVDTSLNSFLIGYCILFVLVVFLYIRLIRKKFIFSEKATFLVVYFSSVYIILRVFKCDTITFTPFKFFFTYSDVIFLIYFLQIGALYLLFEKEKLRKQNKKTEKDLGEKGFFLEDTLYSDDIIDNELILNKLIEVTSGLKPIVSFNIGINAVWGYGKSTFLERFKNKFEDKNKSAIVFWYRIWKNKTTEGIIANFFEELKVQLEPYSGEISDSIDKYVKAVLDLSPSEIQKFVSTGMAFLNNSKTLEGYHLVINNSIKTIDQQIVILLDDLDRLNKEEIFNTLKLIRTISDFNNVIFIAGYDRKYIIDTIEQSRDNYLDKIFNVELNLLPFREERLTDKLFEFVDETYPFKSSSFNLGFKSLFEVEKQTSGYSYDLYFGETFNCSSHKLTYIDFLPTYRDVKRFANEFKFYADFLESDLDVFPSDYILFKLLVYRFRELNDLIFDNLDNLLTKAKLSEVEHKVVAAMSSNNFDIYIYDKRSSDSILKLLVGYSQKNKVIITTALCQLFSKKSYDYYKINQNCIAKVNHNIFYVKNGLITGEIRVSDFQKAFDKNELYKLSIELSKFKYQLQFELNRELNTFIFNKKTFDKAQCIDLFTTINTTVSSYSSFLEDKQLLCFLDNAYIQLFKKNSESFQSFLKGLILKNENIGNIDTLISRININKLRIGSKSKYLIDEYREYEEYDFLTEDFIKDVLIEKLKTSIEQKSTVGLIIEIYHLYTERIVFEKNTVRSSTSNDLLKVDIINRISLYFKSELFDFLKKEKELDFLGFQPNFFLSVIFSKKETVESFLADDSNAELYMNISHEGWSNFNDFLKGLSFKEAGLSNDDLSKVKLLINAFIKNNYVNLSKEKYKEIVDS